MRQLAAVAGAGDQVVERVRDEIQRRHAQPRLDVRERHARCRLRWSAAGSLVARQLQEQRFQIVDQQIVAGREIDADDGRSN